MGSGRVEPDFSMATSTEGSAMIKSVEFEVFGKVQGVFFRKVRELKQSNDKLHSCFICSMKYGLASYQKCGTS